MQINEKFEAPFIPIPGLRLDIVPRWTIVSMSRHQSVAEHSFNVALITGYIAKVKNSHFVKDLMVEALLHDISEEYTGDIPSPAKANHDPDVHPTVKLADLIESYRYAKLYCNDTPKVKKWLLDGLSKKIEKMVSEFGVDHKIIHILLGDLS